MKTTKKAFIAVSMIGFAAMMFSCAGTKKTERTAQETVTAAQEETENEVAPETSAEENPAAEQNADASVQSEASQNEEVPVSE